MFICQINLNYFLQESVHIPNITFFNFFGLINFDYFLQESVHIPHITFFNFFGYFLESVHIHFMS